MDGEHTRAEVLRYLGNRGQAVPPDLDRLVERCLEEMRAAATLRHVTAECGLIPEEDAVVLEGTGVSLPGEAIRRHLAGCERGVLLAATLGVEADGLIRRWERTDLTRSLVLDACATALIEEGCDRVEADIRREAAARGLGVTGRFSPGYGDLPLEVQPEILAALNTGRRIGLTCTDSLILLPRKSVTAVMGLGEGIANAGPRGCVHCPMRDRCEFRKGDGARGCARAAE